MENDFDKYRRTVIDVKDGEILLSSDVFYAMCDKELFVRQWIDSDDSIKLCGITKDNKIYVTEKNGTSFTPEEEDSWLRRCESKFGKMSTRITESDEITTFYVRLHGLLDSKNISHRKMCRQLGICKGTMQNWRCRGNIPSGDMLLRLSLYLDTSVDYLLGNDKYAVNSDEVKLVLKYRELDNKQREALLKLIESF